MAIEFDCPNCQHHYRLKDELAGKTATCKNCRQKIVIPQPVTIPDDPPAVDVEAAEAAALAALADEPAKVEQDAASQIINVECQYCNHKWTEPLARAGKNALCPECKNRVKIPEAKKDQVTDWRQQQSKLPSLAKQNQQKLEGVVDAAADAKIVSGTALKEADATGEEFEPRPLKQKVLFGLLAVGALVGLVFGILHLTRSRTANKEDRLMTEAVEEFKGASETLSKDELPVFTAVIHTAAGEHMLRHDNKEKCKKAMDQFAAARDALRPGSTPARNAACAELACAILVLGGTEEQAREQIRIRWMPDLNLKTRPNERVFTVYEELQKTLALVAGTDLEFRNHLARRLTRELIKRGQAKLADELIPVALFSQTEQNEAKAVVALEIFRVEKGSDLPRTAADELKARGAELSRPAPAASAQTLFLALNVEKAPLVVAAPGGTGAVSDAARYAYTGARLLEGKPDEALAIARRDGRPDSQLRALVLYADWAADPGPALDAALPIVSGANKAKKDVVISPYAVLRLAQIAAAAGKHDLAKQFADQIPDEGLKAWAKGDAVRLRLAAAPKDKGEEAWAEVPDDVKKLRAGHAWARLCLARHNTRVSGSRSDEVKAVSAWPTPLVPFGKAGVALGLQDRDK